MKKTIIALNTTILPLLACNSRAKMSHTLTPMLSIEVTSYLDVRKSHSGMSLLQTEAGYNAYPCYRAEGIDIVKNRNHKFSSSHNISVVEVWL